jgi:outer membrane lipoprotein SlyB
MKRAVLLLTAMLLAGCVSTEPPASLAPAPVTYGPSMRLMDPMIGVSAPPMRSQIVNLGGTPYYVNEAHGVTTVTPGVLQPLRPVTLRPLN